MNNINYIFTIYVIKYTVVYFHLPFKHNIVHILFGKRLNGNNTKAILSYKTLEGLRLLAHYDFNLLIHAFHVFIMHNNVWK